MRKRRLYLHETVDIIGQGPDRTRLERLAWALRLTSSIRFHGYLPGPVRDQRAAQAWVAVCGFLDDSSYAMVILDEFNIALQHDYVRLEHVLPVLRGRPPMQHVVITGRGAKDALIEEADLVTEMKQVKHPFRKGIKAQPGVEF